MAAITCIRCGNAGDSLASPPMGGQIGETILQKVCSTCWNEWVGDQMRFINHYGLQMADPDDRRKLMQVMKEYLNLEAA
jgi:Fe-S cluster biosynthesis and repair protein YggX